MSTEHILYKDAKFAISVDERGSQFNLFVRAVPGEFSVEFGGYDPPHSEGAYLDTDLSPLQLVGLAIRALQAASYHMDETEERIARNKLLEALPEMLR